MNNKIRLIIADDHPIVRKGLQEVIERESDLEVIAGCGDGETALETIINMSPDIAVVDLDMPKMDGFAVLRTIVERQIPVKIIILTVHREEAHFYEALKLGAQGYVLKDSAVEDIVKAIRAVAFGESYASPSMTSYLFKEKRSIKSQSTPNHDKLTPTEREILKLIAEYNTNQQIADKLCISPLTVKTHRRNISIKLKLEGNAALIRFALERKSLL